MSDITVKDAGVKAISKLVKNPEVKDLVTIEERKLNMAFKHAWLRPRDPYEVEKEIRNTCSRFKFAQTAIYAYPRGKEVVKGPTIHLAKMLARAFGNMKFDLVNIEDGKDYTKFRASAWDFEKNLEASIDFIVQHKITTKYGDKILTDQREIYELGMNYGSRRLRKCILDLIPQEIIEDAMELCEETLKKGQTNVPLPDRIRLMVAEFDKIGVSKEMLEKYLNHPMENTNSDEIANLRSIFRTISDREGRREDYFEVPKLTQSKGVDHLESIVGDNP